MPRTQLRSWYDEATDREFYISPDREAEFRRTWPKARPFVLHRGADGSETRVGLSRVESFRAEHPDAQPVYAFLGDDGETVRHVAQEDVGRYVDETNGEDRGTNAAAEGLRAAGRALASPLAGAWNAAVESVASVQEAGARRERAKAERAAPQRLPTLAQLGREIGLPADRLASLSDPDREITARDLEAQEVPQGVRDKYRTLFRHAASADAPQTAEEARHLAEAQRRSAAAQRTREATIEPENAVERAGQTIGGGAETVAEFAAASALGGPVAANAWMAAKGAAAAGERLEAQGASASEAQRLAIPAGLAEAAVWAAPVAHGLAPTSRLAGAAKEAAIAGAKTDLSGVAQRAVTGEETPELRERVLEDLGGAAFGGAMGALSRPERLPRIRERAGLVRDDVHEYVHEYPLSPELIAERRAETRRAAGRESAAEMLPRLREGNAARTTIQQGIEAQTQRHLDDLAGLNGVEAQRRARQVDEILAGNAEPEGQGRVPAALRGEPGIRDTFEPGVSTGPYRNAEPGLEDPTGTMQRPAPYADKIGPRLPETEEGVVAARRAALAALPAGERMKRTSKEAYRSEHEGQTPVLDALGWDAFKTISDRHKGDFRNVVGDREVNATELAGILGRDPRDATAQSLLEEAAAEYENYRRWKEELGAPDAELEAATGREAEWNRQQNDRAVDEARRRWEETHPEEAGEPPLTERDLAGREAAQEQDFVERMESGEPEVPPTAPTQAPIPDEFAPRPAEPAPVVGSATPPPPEPAPAAPEPTRRAAASPQQQLPGAPKLSPLIPDAVSKAAEAVEGIQAKHAAEKSAEVSQYRERFGNVISGDNARAMLGADPKRPETHGQFSKDVDRIVTNTFNAAVEEVRRKGKGYVVFTGGGNGAGKSTVVSNFSDADAVFDSTMTAAEPTRQKINAVLKAGGTPALVFVYRDPVDAWRGVQGRIAKGGHGVTAESFANSHIKARDTFLLLANEFGDSVNVLVYENDGMTPPRRITLDELSRKSSYTKEQLHDALEKQNGSGRTGGVRGETGAARTGEPAQGAAGESTGGAVGESTGGAAGQVGAQAAPAQAAPGLAAPAAPEGGSRRPGVGGGVVTPPPPGSVQARLEGMLAVDGPDAPLTPERSGEYRALADEAGRSGNYATRARALQRLGEFEGLPADHPEAARSLAEHEAGKPLLQLMQLHDLLEIARTFGHGSDPKVKRVLSPDWAAGLFRPEGGRGGVPIIEVLGKLHQTVPQTERQRLAGEAHLEAVRRLGPDAKAKAVKALEAEIYNEKFWDAWNKSLERGGPGQAMNVLAHEIGHWIDYLPDHIQKRGNILGHLAALDKWAKGWIAAEPGQKGKHADVIAAGDAAEAKVLRQPAEPLERFMDRRAKARSAAEEKAALARGFLMKRDVERELSDLVAWYRCSDGLPDYFKDPGELFAEAFSAYCNAPATTRAKAPKFAAALDGWLAERPEAQRAVFEGRARAEKLAAQALRTGRAAPDLDFFGRLQESIAAGTLARFRAAQIRAQRQPKGFKLWQRDVVDDVLQIMEDRHAPLIRRAREVGEWSDPLADELLGALNRFEKAASAHEAELFRYRTEVLPIVEGLEGQQAAFAEYLIVNRIANEVLGKEMDRGRMNLANPEGITPGSSRTPQWGATAQARLKWIQENQPAQWAKLKKAQAALVEIRRGRDHSVLAELRDSGLIRPDAMKEIWDNTDYAAFRRQLCLKDVAPPKIAGRALGEMSTWSGVYKQVTGGYGPVEDPVLATLAGDAMILKLARLNSVRRAAANFLRFHFPDETREVAPDRWHTNSHGEKIPDQTIDGDWRTIVWKENGETRALDVRRRYADPLAKDERLDPDAIERTGRRIAAMARGWSMAMAAANYAFSVKNVPRDKQAVASAMPAKKGARLSNAFGDWGTAMRALVSGHGENREKGLHPDENLLLALETGALPPDVQGGYMAVARGDRLSPLYGPDTPERQAAIRGIIERAGLDPSIEKERSVVAKLFHSFWGRYQQPLNFLGRQESNNKVQAMMEIRAAHPDWSQNRVAWYVSHYVGTPDPTFRPYVADDPRWNLFVPFWTMTAHGNFDQIYRLRWKEQRGVSAIRYGTHAIAKFAFNFSKGAILVGLAKNWAKQAQEADDGTDEGKARAAHLRSLSAMADDFGEMQEAIPVHDRFNSLCIPLAWADREAHKVWYLRLPSDQTITPIDAAAMGAFAIHAKQADFGDIFDGSLSTTMPMPLVGRLGPLPNAIYGALNGVDTGRGFKSIDSPDAVTLMDKIPARALWALKTAGVNVAGLWTKAPWAPADVGENVDALERFLRVPGFNATFGSFLRCSNGGRKSMAHQLDVKETARQARERQLGEKAEQGDESAFARLRESGADVGAVLDRARKRRIKREMYRDPLERTALKFGRKELVRIRSGDDW